MAPKSSPAAALRGAVARDPARLERVIRSDYRFIWRLLRRFGVPELQAEDAAQQVFLIVAERLADIEPGRERAFAFGTALRIAQSMRRRLGRELPSDNFDEQPVGTAAPDELVEQKRARELLDSVLAQLPIESRTVFVLFELEALSSPEIAQLLEVPLGTVASRLRRAREQFRALVAEKRGGR
ncbi:MAG TPA: sigma-70 family RNA polymerase sigma factor [Polyangiales bacterium]|nr:sigma-70 family RNA polymerase sigma factor [Polyangiales bacterium]